MPASLGRVVSKLLFLVWRGQVGEKRLKQKLQSLTHAIFYVYTNAHAHMALLLDTSFSGIGQLLIIIHMQGREQAYYLPHLPCRLALHLRKRAGIPRTSF